MAIIETSVSTGKTEFTSRCCCLRMSCSGRRRLGRSCKSAITDKSDDRAVNLEPPDFDAFRPRELEALRPLNLRALSSLDLICLPLALFCAMCLNAPSLFEGFMDDVFREYLHRFVLEYIDNIRVYSWNLAQHLQHVALVLEKLWEFHMYLKAEKCTFH